MFDTHTHLQFKAFEGKTDEVIKSSKEAGIEKMIVVGTNIETSKKAVQLAEKHEGLYASIGLHPHHVFSLLSSSRGDKVDAAISNLESLILNPKVVAIGETGLDRHIYEKTHYQNYEISQEFINLQKQFFTAQIKLAVKHKKSLIIHNRKAIGELLEILNKNWDNSLDNHVVFHCVEPDKKILDFALKHKVFIGIDGDITYDKDKQEFIKQVPLENLVLETDSPYFIPEPLLSHSNGLNKVKEFAREKSPVESSRQGGESGNPISNEPKNLKLIAEFITRLKQTTLDSVTDITTQNALKLFSLE